MFYHGERFFVEPPIPVTFLESVWIRIGDHRISPEPRIEAGRDVSIPEKRISFYVHADELTHAADAPRIGAPLPTVASVARAARAKEGVKDVGDEIATVLRACKDLNAVYDAAAKYLGVPARELKDKYGHLNHGQQRMNCGNRMRAKWRKEH